MNQTDTPRTNAAINASGGQWSFVLLDCSSELERELTAVTEQRDEARRLAEKYRYLSCDSQAQARPALPDAGCLEQPTNEIK